MIKKPRQGFLKQETSSDWSIDQSYLYWKNPVGQKIQLDHLEPMNFREYDEAKRYSTIKPTKSLRLKEIYLNPDKVQDRYPDLVEARKQLLEECNELHPEDYFWCAPAILKNKKWSDAEKMRFIAVGYTELSGFDYGVEAQRWLEQITWSEKSARNRMNEYFKYLRNHELKNETWISHDEAYFQKLQTTIKIYRGFNVPMNSIIRKGTINQLWLKQETGKSVYFTTSQAVAEYFACSQKLYQAQNHREGERLSRKDRDILEGRLCIAQYQVKLDDVILFQDKTAKAEEEIIVSPEKVQLLSYQFLGFDDFVRVLSKKAAVP